MNHHEYFRFLPAPHNAFQFCVREVGHQEQRITKRNNKCVSISTLLGRCVRRYAESDYFTFAFFVARATLQMRKKNKIATFAAQTFRGFPSRFRRRQHPHKV
jgi:hypothetical protein